MPDGYTGSVESFTKAHADVVNVKEGVEGELKTLWNAIAALQGQWSGSAATAFMTMMRRFETDAKNLNTALEGIAEQLLAAGSTYREQEESKQDVFGSLSQQLEG